MIRLAVFLFLASCCLAQAPTPQPRPAASPDPYSASLPALSTSDKNTIGDAEKAKSDAQAAFQREQELELTVIREWNASHAGWHVNPSNFQVEKDLVPQQKKDEVKKP